MKQRHRGGHPAQVIGTSGPAFESDDRSNSPDYVPDPWQPFEGIGGGWVNTNTGAWQQHRPRELPARTRQGKFTR